MAYSYVCEGGDDDDDDGVAHQLHAHLSKIDCALVETALISNASSVRLQDVELEDGQILRFEVRRALSSQPQENIL